MATANMRHFNSPEEIARRAGEAAGGTPKSKEFRHYNHPEEVAKRAAAGQASSPVAPSRAPRPQERVEVWPPPGEENNAPAEPPVVVEAVALAVSVEPNAKPDTQPPPPRGEYEARIRRLESLLFTFLESAREARHFRMLLNNQAAVTETQQDLVNRVRALELTLTQLTEEDGDDDAGLGTLELTTGAADDDAGQPEGA